MSTATITRRKRLAERIMQIDQDKVLDELEELLIGIEMRARVEESMRDIERGDVMTFEEFRRRSKQWLKDNGIE